jgi:hypothetical protein
MSSTCVVRSARAPSMLTASCLLACVSQAAIGDAGREGKHIPVIDTKVVKPQRGCSSRRGSSKSVKAAAAARSNRRRLLKLEFYRRLLLPSPLVCPSRRSFAQAAARSPKPPLVRSSRRLFKPPARSSSRCRSAAAGSSRRCSAQAVARCSPVALAIVLSSVLSLSRSVTVLCNVIKCDACFALSALSRA